MLYINHGDITKVESGVIAHGVNLQNVMGSGVARALYTKWPSVKRVYHSAFEDFSVKPHLGEADFILVEDDIYVVNCFTQEFYGNDGKRYASPEAIEKALSEVMERMKDGGLRFLHIPRIGCDLGGLDWIDDVHPIIMKLANKYPMIRIDVWEIDERKL